MVAVEAKLFQGIYGNFTVFSGDPRIEREIMFEIFDGQIPIQISGDIPGNPVKIGDPRPWQQHISEQKTTCQCKQNAARFFLPSGVRV